MRDRLRGVYGLAIAVVLLALCPDLILSTGSLAISDLLTKGLNTSLTWIQVANGLSNAGFAAGVVFAAQLGQRFGQRRLFLGYATVFVTGSVLTATASSVPVFLAGRVMQGGATGLMMIAAMPPAVTRYGVRRLPWTVAIVNLGLFGAATLGPIVGGVVAGSGDWRLLLWVVAGAGALALLLAGIGFPEIEPLDPDLRVDKAALALTVSGAVLVFLATSVVQATTLGSVVFWLPFVLGIGAIATLVIVEFRGHGRLMPARELSTQLPVTGTIVAMVAGSAFVTAVQLVQVYLSMVAHEDPATAGALFWPMPVGLVVAAVVFGLVFRTRYLPVLVNLGILATAGGCAFLLELSASSGTGSIPVAALLLGFGAGATVAPGLFLAGLGVRSRLLGRAFALVQLLRLTATYAVGPLVVYIAEDQTSLADGVHLGIWISVVLCLVGLAASLILPAASGARLHEPDLEAWLDAGERGLSSPTVAVHLRPGVEDEEAHPLLPGRPHRHD